MSKLINLVGLKFGKLTVIKRAENGKHNETRWECKCDCGKKVIVKGQSLKRGATKSCGCSKFEEKREREIGKKYGMLTVLKIYDIYKNSCRYLCKCDCGNELITKIDNLKSGKIISCGCYRKKIAKEHQQKMAQVGRVDGTKVQNLNNKIYSSNTSGHRGIHRQKEKGIEKGWIVRIGIGNERKYIGYFADIKDAIEARDKAEEEYWEPVLQKARDANE